MNIELQSSCFPELSDLSLQVLPIPYLKGQLIPGLCRVAFDHMTRRYGGSINRRIVHGD